MSNKCSREFISPFVYFAAASVSLISAYQAFSSGDLSTYDIVCGIANSIATALWFGASIYDIYFVCNMKNEEQDFENEQYNQQDNNIENHLTYRNLINTLKVVEVPDIETKHKYSKSNKKRFLKFSFFDTNEKEQAVLIPINYKMNSEEYEESSDFSYEV